MYIENQMKSDIYKLFTDCLVVRLLLPLLTHLIWDSLLLLQLFLHSPRWVMESSLCSSCRCLLSINARLLFWDNRLTWIFHFRPLVIAVARSVVKNRS